MKLERFQNRILHQMNITEVSFKMYLFRNFEVIWWDLGLAT
ncbi:hypothetical protein [Fulvivirga ligni]|nr:hypothetical protein [Fulvivirga ligni]